MADIPILIGLGLILCSLLALVWILRGNGKQGPPGERGPVGLTGHGERGEKGETGKGEKGDKGDAGADGRRGRRGRDACDLDHDHMGFHGDLPDEGDAPTILRGPHS